MTTTKIIKITAQEILEHYVSSSEDCTIAEARNIIGSADIFYNFKEVGQIGELIAIEITYTH